MPRQRGGNLVILTPANYTDEPTRFPSSHAKVSGRGCAGTKSNIAAAEGKYVSYQKGGNASYDANKGGPVGRITGPNAGPGQFEVNSNTVTTNESAMGAGKSKTVAATLKNMPGGGRKTRKRSTKRSTKRRTKRSTKRSKKHSKGGKKSKRVTKRSRKQRGGKGQPGSNVPISFGYSAGGVLPGDLSALANPAPYHVYDHCTKNNF